MWKDFSFVKSFNSLINYLWFDTARVCSVLLSFSVLFPFFSLYCWVRCTKLLWKSSSTFVHSPCIFSWNETVNMTRQVSFGGFFFSFLLLFLFCFYSMSEKHKIFALHTVRISYISTFLHLTIPTFHFCFIAFLGVWRTFTFDLSVNVAADRITTSNSIFSWFSKLDEKIKVCGKSVKTSIVV